MNKPVVDEIAEMFLTTLKENKGSIYYTYVKNTFIPDIINKYKCTDFEAVCWVKRALKQLEKNGYIEKDGAYIKSKKPIYQKKLLL